MCRCFAFILLMTTWAEASILYDARFGTTPNEQGWTALANPIVGQTSHDIAEGSLTFDSLQSMSDQAGYFSKVPGLLAVHPDSPVIALDEHSHVLDFSLRIVNGTDLPDTDPRYVDQRNRGGFALIVITEDLSGIELQFQESQVITLDDVDSAFPIGESNSFDTTVFHDYRLWLSQAGYRLMVEEEILLQGSLRNYSMVAPAPPFDFPYTTPSFLFFGDDTARAGAVTEFTRLAVSVLGDCNHDDSISQTDLTCVTFVDERDTVLNSLKLLPGDFNGDGAVTFADFLILSKNYGREEVSYLEGNIDLLDGITFADFLQFSSGFGKSQANISNSPEPSITPLTALALLCVSTLRRRRTHYIGAIKNAPMKHGAFLIFPASKRAT